MKLLMFVGKDLPVSSRYVVLTHDTDNGTGSVVGKMRGANVVMGEDEGGCQWTFAIDPEYWEEIDLEALRKMDEYTLSGINKIKVWWNGLSLEEKEELYKTHS